MRISIAAALSLLSFTLLTYGLPSRSGAAIEPADRVPEEEMLLVAGGDVQLSTKQDQSNHDREVYLDEERTSEFWALFVQDEFSLFRDFTINVGVRHDNCDTFGGTTNPRVAAIWSPLPKTTFKHIYGRAFKAPTACELYYHDNSVTTKPNPDLDAESMDTHELIYEQYIGSRLRGTVVGYYYTIGSLATRSAIHEVCDTPIVSSPTLMREEMNLRIVPFEITSPRDIPLTLRNMSREVDVLRGISDKVIMAPGTARQIMLVTFRSRIPFVGLSPTWVKAGALCSLGRDYADLGAQSADLAVRKLEGADLSEIPPEMPRSVRYSVNLKTAGRLQIDIPRSIVKGAREAF